MECKFVVGQKVTLIKPLGAGEEEEYYANWLSYWGPHSPLFGVVYTIRDVFPNQTGVPCLRLIEIRNEPKLRSDLQFAECGWAHTCFRPAHDLSVFHELLKRAPAPKQKERV